MRSFKSNENIHKKEGGSYYVVVTPVLLSLFNAMFRMDRVPDCMKLGVLTSVYKRKVTNLDAKNYRGITITPTIAKKKKKKKNQS